MSIRRAALAGLAGIFLILASGAPAIAAERWDTLPEPGPMPTALRSGLAAVNDIQMYYAVYGTGSPVLLIHGGGGYADQWGAVVTDLSRDHEVIVADSRGHGRSTSSDLPLGYDLMASDYLALLDFLDVKKVAVVGWSDGANIGLDLALHHPERLTRLFAHSGNATVDGALPLDMSKPTMTAIFERNSAAYVKLSPTPDKLEGLVNQLGAMWASEPNWSDAGLAAIDLPVTIAIGDHDEMVSLPHNRHLAETIPGAHFVVLKDVSHFAIFQDPVGYIAAVREFLSD
ncbi:MAG: alpha/beta hydrolase [Devosia sp.]